MQLRGTMCSILKSNPELTQSVDAWDIAKEWAIDVVSKSHACIPRNSCIQRSVQTAIQLLLSMLTLLYLLPT